MKAVRSYLIGSLGVAAAAFLATAPVQAATIVDTELQLLVDVSGSVDASEFALQRDGYVNAFKTQPSRT